MPLSQVKSPAAEQRRKLRHRIKCRAWIDLGDGSEARSCTVWDVSEAGARISVQSPGDVPGEFLLVLSDDGKVSRRCRVIWRTDEQLGARYLSAPNWNWTA